MGRSKYTIQPFDLAFAWRWINKKLSNPLWLGEATTYKAYEGFIQLDEHDAGNLNQWCESWLTSDHWRQLKNAIRAGRKRCSGEQPVSVTLSRNAWSILDYWAGQDNSTLSQVIERRLGVINKQGS